MSKKRKSRAAATAKSRNRVKVYAEIDGEQVLLTSAPLSIMTEELAELVRKAYLARCEARLEQLKLRLRAGSFDVDTALANLRRV